MAMLRRTTLRRPTGPRALRYTVAALLAAMAIGAMPFAAGAASEAPMGYARLRVIDLAAFATPAQGIRVSVDGYTLAGGLGFGSSSAYATLLAGRHTVQVYNAATGASTLDATIRLMAGRDYSYLIEGRLRGTVRPVLATDDNAPVTGTMARVRFANAVPAGTIVTARLSGGAATFSATAFNGIGAYKDVPAGTYTLEITSVSGRTITTVTNIALAPGQVYTLFATNLSSPTVAAAASQAGTVVATASGLGSEIMSTASQTTTVAAPAASLLRVVDVVPASVAITPFVVSLDGRPIATSLGFGGATGYLSVASGQHRLQIARITGGPALVDSTVSLAPRGTYSFVVERLSPTTIGGVLSSAENGATGVGLSRVRIGNVALGAQAVQVALIGATSYRLPLTTAGAFSTYAAVPAGRYVVELLDARGMGIAVVPNVMIQAGQTYTLFTVEPSGRSGIAPVVAVSSFGGELEAPAVMQAPVSAPATPAGQPVPVLTGQATTPTSAHLRFANLIQGIGAQSYAFYVDGQQLTAPVGFGAYTAFTNLAEGTHRLLVTGPTGVVLSTTVTVRAGASYTFAAEGVPGSTLISALLPVSMPPATSAQQASVRFANAIPGSGSLTASLLNVRTRLGYATFGKASTYHLVPGGTYNLYVRTLTGKGLAFVRGVTIQPGKTYTIFAVPQAGSAAAAVTIIPNE